MNHSNYEIIRCDESGHLSFDSGGFKSILDKVPNIPIVIFSVAGKYRIGKSFLLNALIPVLEYYRDHGTLEGFKEEDLDFHMHGTKSFVYKGGHDSQTKGIHLLNTPFIIPNPNDPTKKVAILLMDSQGLDAIDVKGGVDQVLFTLTNFLSSHIIYNVCGNIEPNKLLSLIQLASHSKNHRKDLFTSLDIIIRDYKFEKHDIESMRRESENYVNKLSRSKGSIVETNLRELDEYFRFVRCYPLPHPGRKVELTKFDGDRDEIKREFIDLIYDYIFILADEDHIVSKFESGEQLLRLFETMCNETLNKERINADEFYKIITENKDNNLFNKFKTEWLNPLKIESLNLSLIDFTERIEKINHEFENVINNLYYYDQKRITSFHTEIMLIETDYYNELDLKKERASLEEKQRILQQERDLLNREQSQQRYFQNRIDELRRIPPPVPTYVYEHKKKKKCVII